MSKVPTHCPVEVSVYGFSSPVNPGWTSWNRVLKLETWVWSIKGICSSHQARAGDETTGQEKRQNSKDTHWGTSLGW